MSRKEAASASARRRKILTARKFGDGAELMREDNYLRYLFVAIILNMIANPCYSDSLSKNVEFSKDKQRKNAFYLLNEGRQKKLNEFNVLK